MYHLDKNKITLNIAFTTGIDNNECTIAETEETNDYTYSR